MTRGSLTSVRPLPRRSRLILPALAIATSALAAGCAEEGSAERLLADAPIFLEASQSYVTLENRAGLPLVNIRIAIIPYGPAEYSRIVPRIENSAKRQIPLGEFRGRDGTPFNLRVARPQSLKVTAKDLNGKDYEFEIPWND